MQNWFKSILRHKGKRELSPVVESALIASGKSIGLSEQQIAAHLRRKLPSCLFGQGMGSEPAPLTPSPDKSSSADSAPSSADSSNTQRITTAQKQLKRLGFMVSVNGLLDTRSKIEIKAFEKSRNLAVIGEVDELLLEQLAKALQEVDDKAWSVAQQENSEQGYEVYLSQQKAGRYRNTADSNCKKLQQVRKERKAREASNTEPKLLIGTMLRIPSGNFQMGSLRKNKGFWAWLNGSYPDNEKPQHQVNINTFNLGETAVTFAMWDACVADGGCTHKPDDMGWGRGNRPVINVSYNDITKQFIPWLNKQTGQVYRLPTEAEWEYAARSGSSSDYSWGDKIGSNNANCSDSGSQWSGVKTARVKSFSANGFGLYDMHGNVWEWTQDCWNNSYSGAPTDGSAWLRGDCSSRVLRGGSWINGPSHLRSAGRGGSAASIRDYTFGFRLAQDKR